MLSRLRRLQPATLIALLALFVSLGGTAAAVTMITGRNVKDGSLTGRDIRDDSIAGRDIRDGSIAANDLESALVRGSRGPVGAVGPAGPVGDPGLRGPQGVAGVAGADPWGAIPSGQLVTGSERVHLEGKSTTTLEVSVQLPALAPIPLTAATVNFSQGSVIADVTDADQTCGGTSSNPVPAAGKVCIYVVESELPDNVASGSASGESVPDGRSGFAVQWNPQNSTAGASYPSGFAFTWAYLAP